MPEIEAVKIETPLANKDLKVRYAKQRPVPPNAPRLHFIASFVGMRGTGKTTAAINMLKAYFGANSFDKLYLISGSATTEPKYKLLPPAVMSMETYTDAGFNDMVSHIKKDLLEYEEYERDLKVWDLFERSYIHGDKTEDDMDLNMYLTLDRLGFRKPETRFKHGAPSSVILVDDMAGSKLYRSDSKGPVSSFAFKHRHLLSSMVFVNQSFTSAGVPRSVRANVSFLVLFRTKDRRASKQIAEESAGHTSPEDFLALWEFATKDSPHDFLAVDNDEPDDSKRYRKNFDSFLILKK